VVSPADKVEAARAKWNAASAAWSKDDCSDAMATMQAGERMMYAATDLICALEDQVDDLAGR
jgi:hypothetical protein